MTLKKQNPWKLLSIGLLGIIAIGLLAPVDAKPPSGEKSNQFDIIFELIADLEMQVDDLETQVGHPDRYQKDKVSDPKPPGEFPSTFIHCDNGDTSVGGGVSGSADVDLRINGPLGVAGWEGLGLNTDSVNDATITVTVICLDTADPPH